jgi:polar amino acid transport system permease protein
MSLVDTFFNVDVMTRTFPMLLIGVRTTVLLGLTCIVLGSLLGFLVALARLYGWWPARLAAVAFTDIFRSLPALVSVVLVYFALPFVGIRLDSFPSAAIALSVVFAAFAAEIFRAGIEAVPRGQLEAAAALGLSFPVTLLKVVVPQAFRIVLPPYTSNCIEAVKATSLAAFVAMPDLLKQAFDAQALTANPSPIIAAALIYLAILWPMVRLLGFLEARSKQAER